MTQTIYDIQDIAQLQGSFTDINGNPVDPTAILCWVKTPDENVQTFSYSSGAIIKTAIGQYYYNFTISMSGIHIYRFEGTGAVQAGKEQSFTVQASKIITG